ncbi:hypothetical protein CLF_104565 [Clonorchis sinensis]|uniref:Pol-related protein n=1 Tax=Clonorchis sinensis TaxID=79923 RepID=G7YBX3_CLOSI|nr:hypothetical protein CLF_104565 [Clonorchis sinensis]
MHGEKGPEDITRIDAEKDLGIWLSPNLSSLHLEKSAQKAFAALRMIRRTFSRITRTDFQILYGAYVRPLLEYANPVVYSGRTKDVIPIERVQRATTKMVAGLKSMDYEALSSSLKSMDYETRLVVLDLFPLEYRRLRGDLILTYALFEQGLANRFFTVDPANTRRGHGERQLLNDKNKTDPGNLGKSLALVYQSVNPRQIHNKGEKVNARKMGTSPRSTPPGHAVADHATYSPRRGIRICEAFYVHSKFISSDCSVADEVNARICKARAPFANLKHLWHHVVYLLISRNVCITLQYGLCCCMAVSLGPSEKRN